MTKDELTPEVLQSLYADAFAAFNAEAGECVTVASQFADVGNGFEHGHGTQKQGCLFNISDFFSVDDLRRNMVHEAAKMGRAKAGKITVARTFVAEGQPYRNSPAPEPDVFYVENWSLTMVTCTDGDRIKLSERGCAVVGDAKEFAAKEKRKRNEMDNRFRTREVATA